MYVDLICSLNPSLGKRQANATMELLFTLDTSIVPSLAEIT